jgi:uncharacterized lipoprotein YmbA
MPTANYKPIAVTKVQVGVKKVEVPPYLDGDKILVKQNLEVKEIGANFVAPPSELLTSKTIEILKSSLNNPNIFLYPWDVKSKRGYIVDIKLDKFIYDSGYAVVEGSYYIKSASGNLIYSKNFKKIKPSSSNVNSIVDSLSKLFDSVVVEIARKIAK